MQVILKNILYSNSVFLVLSLLYHFYWICYNGFFVIKVCLLSGFFVFMNSLLHNELMIKQYSIHNRSNNKWNIVFLFFLNVVCTLLMKNLNLIFLLFKINILLELHWFSYFLFYLDFSKCKNLENILRVFLKFFLHWRHFLFSWILFVNMSIFCFK